MTRKIWTIVPLLFGLSLFLPPSSEAKKEKPHLIIVYSSSVRGSLRPCGCKIPAGGIARRSTYIKKVQREYQGTPILILDGGNFTTAYTREGEIKSLYLTRAMSLMGYTAANIGQREFHLGNPFWKKLRKEARFPLISANIEEKGKYPFRRFLIKRFPKEGISVGITGILPPVRRLYPGDETSRTTNPEKALKELIPELRKSCDIVILLSAMKMTDSERLAREVPGIDIIVGSYSFNLTKEPKTVNNTYILYGGSGGKNLGLIFLYLNEKRKIRLLRHKLVLLDPKIKDDPMMLKLIKQAEEEINRPPR